MAAMEVMATLMESLIRPLQQQQHSMKLAAEVVSSGSCLFFGGPVATAAGGGIADPAPALLSSFTW